jgi:hypothetical protein
MLMQQRTAVVRSAADCVHDNLPATTMMQSWKLNGWYGSKYSANACSSTAVHHSTQQIVYMITAQLQSKIHSWNEWLAWLCSFSNAHMQQRTAEVQHLQTIVTDKPYSHNQRCTAGMMVGMACLLSNAHTQQRTA